MSGLTMFHQDGLVSVSIRCRPSLTVVEHFVHLADDMNDEVYL